MSEREDLILVRWQDEQDEAVVRRAWRDGVELYIGYDSRTEGNGCSGMCIVSSQDKDCL